MKKMREDPFPSLPVADLASVNGGRVIPNKGPDAAVVQGIELLVKTIAEVGQALAANGQAQSQQMMQLVQQMMEKRRAG